MSSYLERLTAYASRVASGAEVAGPFERLAVRRFFRDLHDKALKTAGARNALQEMEAAEGRLGIGAVGKASTEP